MKVNRLCKAAALGISLSIALGMFANTRADAEASGAIDKIQLTCTRSFRPSRTKRNSAGSGTAGAASMIQCWERDREPARQRRRLNLSGRSGFSLEN